MPENFQDKYRDDSKDGIASPSDFGLETSSSYYSKNKLPIFISLTIVLILVIGYLSISRSDQNKEEVLEDKVKKLEERIISLENRVIFLEKKIKNEEEK